MNKTPDYIPMKHYALNEEKLARQLAERTQENAKLTHKIDFMGGVLKDMTEAYKAAVVERGMYSKKWVEVSNRWTDLEAENGELKARLAALEADYTHEVNRACDAEETVRSLRASLRELLK